MKQRLILLLRSQWGNILFAFRATTAAICALVAAELLNLECPYWAALTALIVIQPSRGLIFEKSVYRLVGTGIGSLAGLLLVLNFHSPLTLTLALALWVGSCVAIGSVSYGLRSYGCMMAGMTCAVIAMSGVLNGSQFHEIAFARVVCIVIGISVATAITAFVTPKRTLAEVSQRLNHLSTETISWLGWQFREGNGDSSAKKEQELLIELAEIESLIDVVLAGSLHSRQEIRQTTNLISALLNLLGAGCLLSKQKAATPGQFTPQQLQLSDRLADQLRQLAEHQDCELAKQCLAELTETIRQLKSEQPLLQLSLTEVAASLHRVLQNRHLLCKGLDTDRSVFVRHRDWREGIRAALRAAVMIAGAGALWTFFDWHYGPLSIMALSIMLTIFATKDHPAHLMRHVLAGATIGALAAIVCRMYLLPGHPAATVEYLTMTPFLLTGIWCMTQKRTAMAATDGTFIFLLTLQPGMITQVRPFDMAFGALAMLLGIGSSWLAYRYLFPINPAMRMRALLDSTSKDLQLLALGQKPSTLLRIEARMKHKIIRTVIMAKHYDTNYVSFIDGGLLALAVMTSFQQLRKLFENQDVPDTARAILRKALTAIEDARQQPQQLLQTLHQAIAVTQTVMDRQQKKGSYSLDCTFAQSLQTAAMLMAENIQLQERCNSL